MSDIRFAAASAAFDRRVAACAETLQRLNFAEALFLAGSVTHFSFAPITAQNRTEATRMVERL